MLLCFEPSVKKGVRGNSFPPRLRVAVTKLKVDRPHAILLPVTHEVRTNLNWEERNQKSKGGINDVLNLCYSRLLPECYLLSSIFFSRIRSSSYSLERAVISFSVFSSKLITELFAASCDATNSLIFR